MVPVTGLDYLGCASYGIAVVQPAASDTPPRCHIEMGSSSCLQKK